MSRWIWGCTVGTPRPVPGECVASRSRRAGARLTSVDLGAMADLTSLAEVFDFARDYLGLLKAAVIASDSFRPASRVPDSPSLTCFRPDGGPGPLDLEIVSCVNDIPRAPDWR